MDSFTFIKKCINTVEFKAEYDSYRLNQLRHEIYIFLISRKSEDDFFDLTAIKNLDLHPIYEDLIKAGWKYALGFNDTGLFIFKETKPITCWE